MYFFFHLENPTINEYPNTIAPESPSLKPLLDAITDAKNSKNDSLVTSPSLNHIDSTCSSSSFGLYASGTRRKSPLENRTATDSQPISKTPILNGAKKKIRANGCLKPSLAMDDLPQQDYYNIWTASESYEHNPEEEVIEDVAGALVAPPLPPRAGNGTFHRPLERSSPRIVRQQAHSSDSFSFDIVDTDDPNFSNYETTSDAECVDFIPGEFFEERRQAGDGQADKRVKQRDEIAAPLATPETDGSLSDNILRLGGPPKFSLEPIKLRPLLKKKIGPDNYISTILTQKVIQTSNHGNNYNFPSPGPSHERIVAEGATSDCSNLVGEFIPLKTHKPLSRQLSNGKTRHNGQEHVPNSSVAAIRNCDSRTTNSDEVNRHFALCRKPSPHSPTCHGKNDFIFSEK